MIIDEKNINRFIIKGLFDCSSQNITEIKFIPNNITYFYCDNNKLTKLPKLLPMGDSYGIPESLISLSCHSNFLTKLPKLPKSIIYLRCDNNKLKSLPYLSGNLIYIKSNDNNLNFFPNVHNIDKWNNIIKLRKRLKIIKKILG